MFCLTPETKKTACTSKNNNDIPAVSNYFKSISRKISPCDDSKNFDDDATTLNHRSRLMKTIRAEFLKQKLSVIVHYWANPSSEEECFACLLNTMNRALSERCITSLRFPDSTYRKTSNLSEYKNDEKDDSKDSLILTHRQAFSHCLQPVSPRFRSNSNIEKQIADSPLKYIVPRLNLDKNLQKMQASHSFNIQNNQKGAFRQKVQRPNSGRNSGVNGSISKGSLPHSGCNGIFFPTMMGGRLSGKSASRKRGSIETLLRMKTPSTSPSRKRESMKTLIGMKAPSPKENVQNIGKDENLLSGEKDDEFLTSIDLMDSASINSFANDQVDILKTNRNAAASSSERKRNCKCTEFSNMHTQCEPRDTWKAAPMLTVMTPKSPSQMKKKNLVVEDDVSILKFMTKLFGKTYTVESASNGFLGLNLMQETAYHAVLMDLNMPVLDGFEAIKRFRKWEAISIQEGSRIKRQIIIVCSANAHESHVQSALNCGANAFVTKPLNVKEVIKMIEDLNSK